MYNNIDDFLKSIDNFTSFEGLEIINNDYNLYEIGRGETVPEGFSVVENYVGGEKLIARQGTTLSKPAPVPSFVMRGGSQGVFDFSVTANAVASSATKKILLVDFLLHYLADYNTTDFDTTIKQILGVTNIGFDSNKEYYVNAPTGASAVNTTTKASFNLYHFFKRMWSNGRSINIVSLRLNIPSTATTLQSRIESAYLSLFSVTPQQRFVTQQINIAPFVDPKSYNRNIIDIPLNLTLREGDIMFLENPLGFTDVNTALNFQGTVTYR